MKIQNQKAKKEVEHLTEKGKIEMRTKNYVEAM